MEKQQQQQGYPYGGEQQPVEMSGQGLRTEMPAGEHGWVAELPAESRR